VAEINARDLRRLESLEGRLGKADDERKALREERRELRSALKENRREVRDARRDAAELEEKIAALIDENASLATQLEQATTDLESVRAAAEELKAKVDAEDAELREARAALDGLRRDLRLAQAERQRLGESLKLAQEQLTSRSQTPVLPAKDIARNVERLVSELGSNLPGMNVRNGELQLRVAFAQVGETTGFVLPSADSPPEVRENLHEITLRFDRAGVETESES
jgi:chromosome segregation ATPase